MYFTVGMPNPIDESLRIVAVRAYEAGRGTCAEVAAMFGVGTRTLRRWVKHWRTHGDVTAQPKRGGWVSPIRMPTLEAVLAEAPDATCAELCWAAHPSRAAHPPDHADQSLARDPPRGIRQQKKRPRPSELDRPDVQRKRATFVTWRRRIDPDRLVFLDEAGANLSMGRSHAWVKKGQVHVEPRPMNWGKNLTMIGAIRRRGWVTLATQWTAATAESFVTWVRRRLVPALRPGDIVVLDNLRAHTDPRVARLIRRGGARVHFLPPYGTTSTPLKPPGRS